MTHAADLIACGVGWLIDAGPGEGSPASRAQGGVVCTAQRAEDKWKCPLMQGTQPPPQPAATCDVHSPEFRGSTTVGAEDTTHYK